MTENTSELSLTLEELRQFFERRPVLHISPVGQEAGLSKGHLNRVLKGERILSQKTITKLWPVLRKYGYGYQMSVDSIPKTLTIEQLHDFLNEYKSVIKIATLADEIALSKGHFHQILSGKRGFTKNTAQKLLDVLPRYGFSG